MRPTEARAIISRERELQCLDLKRSGHSFREIGLALDITEQGASKAFKRAMNRTIVKTAETVEEIKATELARLDGLIKAHWPFAVGAVEDPKRPGSMLAPDPVRAGVIFRAMERRSALLGLDAPRVIKIDEDKEDIDDQITELLRRLKLGVIESTGEVPVTVEIDCTAQSVDPLRRMGELALHGRPGLGQDQDRG